MASAQHQLLTEALRDIVIAVHEANVGHALSIRIEPQGNNLYRLEILTTDPEQQIVVGQRRAIRVIIEPL